MDADAVQRLLAQVAGSTWAAAAVWFAGLWATCLFVRKVSKDADGELAPDKREEIAARLLTLRTAEPGDWVPDFTRVFDQFFGERHLSLRCLMLSVVLSISVFVALSALLGLMTLRAVTLGATPANSLISVVIVACLVNAFIDYVSLLETRLLLRARLSIVARLIIDMLLTLALPLAWLVFLRWLLGPYPVMDEVVAVGSQFAGTDGTPWSIMITRITVLTSFCTSVWLWLHGSAQLTIKLANGAQWFIGFLNVRDRPLRAVGTTINALLLTLGALAFPVFILTR